MMLITTILSNIVNGATHITQHTTHNTQHTTHNTQHTTHNTQHTTHNTQHTTHNTQHTTHITQHKTHNTGTNNIIQLYFLDANLAFSFSFRFSHCSKCDVSRLVKHDRYNCVKKTPAAGSHTSNTTLYSRATSPPA